MLGSVFDNVAMRAGGAGGRRVVLRAAAAVQHHEPGVHRGAAGGRHRVLQELGVGPGEASVPRRQVLRPAEAGRRPREEGGPEISRNQAREVGHGCRPRLRRPGRRDRKGTPGQLGHPPGRPPAHDHLRHVLEVICLDC
jgi:hypothetical protein